MTFTKLLTTGLLVGLAYGGAMGCAARDCNDAERDEVDADDDDTCTKIEGLKTFTDEAKQDLAEDWEAGDDLLINGDSRELKIVRGDSDTEVEVSFRAQVDLAEGRSDKEVIATMENLTNDVSKSSGRITVSSDRGDSESNLGSIAVVSIPADFDGAIKVDLGGDLPGFANLEFTGDATELEIDRDSGGDVDVEDASKLTSVVINNKGKIAIDSPFTSDDLEQVAMKSGIGKIIAVFEKVPSKSARLVTDFGDIEVGLPSSGDYTMQVQATEGVNLRGEPSSCEVDDDDDQAQSMTCGAGSDGVTFQIDADGEALIRFP